MQIVLLAFLTGLTTGGFSCLAVQGGLLMSAIPSTGQNRRWALVASFLAAKLISYTIVGFVLGLIGSVFTLSPKLMGSIQILVGLFMLATAARILDIHPVFRYFVIQPPRFVYRFIKNKSRDATWLTPFFMGILTIFLPCGITQATMTVAVASGNPLTGAAIMFAFILGTSPVFFVLGASFVELLNHKAFVYVAAAVVAIFAVLSINGGLALTGSFYTLQNFYRAATTDFSAPANENTTVAVVNGVQEVTIDGSNRGYSASATTLKKGIPVRLTLKTDNTQGCSRAFTIPDYNIYKVLQETGQETIEFTPQTTGRLVYSCSMGMYTGTFTVIQ
jgi:uncharacterized protein